jgi:hypothetical protein
MHVGMRGKTYRKFVDTREVSLSRPRFDQILRQARVAAGQQRLRFRLRAYGCEEISCSYDVGTVVVISYTLEDVNQAQGGYEKANCHAPQCSLSEADVPELLALPTLGLPLYVLVRKN